MKYANVWDIHILDKLDDENIREFLEEYELDPTWYIFCKYPKQKEYYMLVNDKQENLIRKVKINPEKKYLERSFGSLEKRRYKHIEISTNLLKSTYIINYTMTNSSNNIFKYYADKKSFLGNQEDKIKMFPEIVKQLVIE